MNKKDIQLGPNTKISFKWVIAIVILTWSLCVAYHKAEFRIQSLEQRIETEGE